MMIDEVEGGGASVQLTAPVVETSLADVSSEELMRAREHCTTHG
jgi:hypothetical protein